MLQNSDFVAATTREQKSNKSTCNEYMLERRLPSVGGLHKIF